MYERYYGFREKPFSMLPDPAFLYLGRQHSAAYTLLEYGVLNQAGFTVVTGDIGCGKTTLIRHLLNQLDKDVTVGLLSNTHKGFSDLLRWVLMAFGLDYASKGSVQLYETFVEFLIAEYERRRRVVLIVDEAQNLDAGALEELRTLSNINADKHLILQLILVGQPELRETLERPELKQLAQRVVAHYHLTSLTEEETSRYISHRIEHAGCSADLFTPDARRQICRYSDGVPRLINLLCDTALTYGYAEEVWEIGEDLIQSVISDRAAGMNLGARHEQLIPQQQPTVCSIPSADETRNERVARRSEAFVEFDRSDARQLFSHLLK